MCVSSNLVRSPSGTNKGRLNVFPLLKLEHSPFPALGHNYFWFQGLGTQNWTYTMGFPGSQASVFGLELHH